MSDEDYGGGGGLFGSDLGGGVFDPTGAGTMPPLAEEAHYPHAGQSVAARGEAQLALEQHRPLVAMPAASAGLPASNATRVSPGLPFDPAALDRAARSAPPPGPRLHPQARARRQHPLNPLGEATPEATSNLLGLALVLIPVAAVIGWKLGGASGALGGGLVGGALVNAYRAATSVGDVTPEANRETVVSGTYAVVGAGVGGYLLYRGSRPYAKNAKRRASRATEPVEENAGGDEDDDDGEASTAPDSPHRI